MRESFGPYRTGEQVRRGDGWSLHRGRHQRTLAEVWMLRVDGAAHRLEDVKRRVGALGECDAGIAVPTALSPDGEHLVSLTERADACALDEFTPPDIDAVRMLIATACAALAGLQEFGLVHGQLDGWLIDVEASGRARLRGTAELADAGDEAAQLEDDRQLGRVLRHALRDVALPVDLDVALRELSRGARTARDVAGMAATEQDDGATAEPVAVSETAPDDGAVTERDLISALRAPVIDDSGERPQRRRHGAPDAPLSRRTRWLSGAAAIVLVVLAAVVWLTREHRDPPHAIGERPVETLLTTVPDEAQELEQRLHELYAARTAAISEGDRMRLDSVYTPDAPMRAQDESLISQLAADGVRLEGFALTLVAVQDVAIDGAAASVVVVDEIEPFELINVDGSRTKVNGRPEATTALTLVMGETGWLIRAAERL